MPMSKAALVSQVATEITKHLSDQGRLVEAGFAALRHLVIPRDAPPIQVEDMKMAFMAGAEHLFSSVMGILDPGSEPTERDLKRMELISNELDEWRDKLKAYVMPTQGRA